jgi:hypothetical protein
MRLLTTPPCMCKPHATRSVDNPLMQMAHDVSTHTSKVLRAVPLPTLAIVS